MTTGKTEKESKGISIISMALVILVVGTFAITGYIFWSYEQKSIVTGKSLQDVVNEVNDLRDRMERLEKVIPKQILEQIYAASDAKFGIGYVEVANYTAEGMPTKAIAFENIGTIPLSDFKVLLNDIEIKPYYKPTIVFAGEKGIVVLEFQQWLKWASTEGVVKIKTVKDLSLDIKAGKGAAGITGFFVLHS